MLDIKKEYYFDLDGVIADFNIEPNGVERFKTEKGFFRNLRPITTNLMAVKILMLKGYKVKVLTASPNNGADIDKLSWLEKYLPELKKKNIIICRNGEVKAKYVRKIKKSILFDDYGLNCRQFIANGGQAVKITTDRQLIRMVTAE